MKYEPYICASACLRILHLKLICMGVFGFAVRIKKKRVAIHLELNSKTKTQNKIAQFGIRFELNWKKKIISRELSLREAAVAAMIAEELVSFQHKLDYYWYLHNGNLLSLPSLWTDLQSIAFIYCTAFSV